MTRNKREMNQQAARPDGVTIRVFGGAGVDGDDPRSIGGPRQRRLLALLAIRSGSFVSIDWLAEHLWTDDDRPDATAPALRTYLSRLRQSLPEAARSWIATEPAGYRLDAPDAAVEHRRVAMLRAQATAARDAQDPQSALAFLDEALGLWRGQPFRELEDLSWARVEIEQLEVDHLEMIEERWEVALALGRHTQITGELAAFTAEHRLRERPVRQLMLALHRSGRTTEALRIADQFRRTLAEQSGLEPSADLRELADAMLRGDPSLASGGMGQPLRGYRLLEEIGSGAFSTVWRSLQPSVDREVAIKEIRSDLATNPAFIRRFEAEAHLVARLEHPHIVPLIDFWRDPDSAYLVMRWLRGGTLERRVDDGPMSIDAALRVGTSVGSALAFAHSRGVVHRDVKPANILFDEQGNAYLGDFGIALEAAETRGAEVSMSPGSAGYAAPEQVRGERTGPQADIFSLAVVLYECLAGAVPSPGSALSLRELRTDVSAATSDAVERAMSTAPHDRFDTIEAFLTALHAGDPRTNDSQPLPIELENPYRGLLYFDEVDEASFYGRDDAVAQMVERLGTPSPGGRCLAVVGPSGSGKSSVVRAGLLPALRSGAVSGSADWYVTTMVPGDDAFEALEAALLRVAVNPPPSLVEQLRDGSRGILRGVRRCLPTDDDTVVLVIDQFEEIFTAADRTEADAFLTALATAVQDPNSPLRLVITLRADYYHRPLEHPTFATVFTAATLDLTPLAPHELEQAMIEPARRLGVGFEPGLPARIAAETIGQPSPLPLLQYVLRELFERRSVDELTVRAYDELGGLSGALAARAEAIHAAMSVEEQEAARRVLGRLTKHSEGAADLRTRVPVADLGAEPSVRSVLDQFGRARLITFDHDAHTREPTAEVAHEALLREWPRLVSWLAEDREVLRTVGAVGAAASTWAEGGRSDEDLYRAGRLETAVTLAASSPERLRPLDHDFIDVSKAVSRRAEEHEKRRVTRLRRLNAGIAVALIVALMAGGLALRAQRNADARATEADLATLISRSAALGREDPTVSVLLALEANRRTDTAETRQAVMSALGSSPAANRVMSHGALATEDCPGGLLAGDGFHEHGLVDGVFTRRELSTGVTTSHGSSPVGCVFWAGDPTLDFQIRMAPDQRRFWFGTFAGEPTARDFDTRLDITSLAVSENGLIPGVLIDDDRTSLVVLHARTGDLVLEPVHGLGWYGGALALASDGSIAAFATGALDRSEGDGNVLVVEVATGRVILDLDTPLPAQRMVIDERTDELLLVGVDGTITTVDLATGEIVATTQVGVGEAVYDVEIRPDGTLAIITSGEVHWVDRRLGTVRIVAELRDVVWASYRPDDTVVVVTNNDRIEVLDLDGGALLERSYETATDVRVTFGAGFAGVVDFDSTMSSRPSVLDLSTGARRTVPLADRDGTPFVPLVVYPEADGVLAVSNDVAARWAGGSQVARLELPGGPTSIHPPIGDVLALVIGGVDGRVLVVDRASLAVRYSIDVPGASAATPDHAGGVHVFDEDGRLYSFDETGAPTGTFETDLKAVDSISLDPASGRLVVEGRGDWQGIAIVDPAAQTVTPILVGISFSTATFVDHGAMLAIVGLDGTVRLWDIERQESAGLAWDGAGALDRGMSWWDADTNSLWVATTGQIVEIPLDPDRWIERACDFAGRELTAEEWRTFVPGDQGVQSSCHTDT